MIESMACGTPVIASRWGAVPEVIEEGRGGVIVGDWGDAARGARADRRISPETCRAYAEERFKPERMVADYLAAYETLLV